MTDSTVERNTRNAVWATIDHIISELEAASAELDKEWERAVEKGEVGEAGSMHRVIAREAVASKQQGVFLAMRIATKAYKAYEFSPEAQPASV